MRALLLLAVLPILVGCVNPGSVVQPASASLPIVGDPLHFSPLKMIDTTRAGGEPVIAITPKGTLLVGAHPGWTHTRYPPGANLLTPATGQSYLWRSTDNGATWSAIGLPGANGVGPRGLGQGVSDPDFAVDKNGRIYFTDLEALAAASVSWSDDDGATWLQGNDVASTYGPIDRNWLATHGSDIYFMGNFPMSGELVTKSTDGGLTWSKQGVSPCEGDFIIRDDGAILTGCGDAIGVSVDDGKTFQKVSPPDAKSNQRVMTEPAIDSAGNVYTSWADEKGVWVAGTADLGKTWFPSILIPFNGTAIWPWIVAGDAGRVAVVWYGTNATGGPTKAVGDWFVHEATILRSDAKDGAQPELSVAQVTATPVFKGGICQEGTQCQTDPTPAGDRRLGDFFEAAVDANGRVNVVFAVAGADSISHPGFARQTDGPSLFEAPRAPSPH